MTSQRQHFLRHLAQTNDAPLMLEIEKAEGIYLYDTSGKKYIDLIAGISVSGLGHRNPKVVDAIKVQLDKYMHLMVYGEYVQAPQVEYAKLLTSLLPEQLSSVYFVNSGTEATEGAMKLAKRFTGRREIVAFNKSYHGSTQGALSIMGDENFRRAFRPLLPGIKHLNFNVPGSLIEISKNTACVIAEIIQAEAGVNVPSKEFMQQLRERCDETGALLILDEIQTGLGRTGKLFAFEHYDIVPDILLLAKSFGGGMPLGAFVSSQEIMSSLKFNPALGHITTFGGHPVSCAAGLAALKVLLDEKLTVRVEKKEKLFQEKLVHPKIRAVRSKGLLIAVEFDSFDTNKKVIARCIENGVITDWFLFASHCMRIAPPLIISEEEINHACSIIHQSINEAA